MKTCRILLSGCTALAVGLSTAVGWAAPANQVAIDSLTASAVVGQWPGFLGGDSTPQTDAFTAAGRGREGNPPMQQAGPAPMGAQQQNMASQDAQILLQARKWLAVGDTRRAAEYVNQAKSRGVQYGAFGDTPRKIEDAINMQNNLMANQAQAGNTEGFRRQYATHLLEQCDWLVKWGAMEEAESLAHSVKAMNVVFSPYERNPDMMLNQIAQSRGQAQQQQPGAFPGNFGGQAGPRYDNAVQQAGNFGQTGGVQQAGGAVNYPRYENQAMYQGANQGAIQQVQGLNFPNQPAPAVGIGASVPNDMVAQAETALQQNDANRARQIYLQLEAQGNQLDPATRQRVQDRLALLGRGPQGTPGATGGMEPSALRQQVSADLAEAQRRARERQQVYPREALRVLEDARIRVAQAPLDPDSKGQLLRRVDGDIASMHRYMEENAPQIELDDQNRSVLAEIDRERAERVEIQQRLASLVNEYNMLMDQERFAEAELVARRARDMAPQEPVVQQLMHQSRLIRSIALNRDIRSDSQDGVLRTLASVDEAAIPHPDNEPFRFPDAFTWEALSRNRRPAGADRVRSEREIEIEQKLRTPVSLRFTNAPLSEVIDYLARLAEVNIHLDPQGMAMEGVTSAVPVTVELSSDVSLKSALNLVLEPLRLDYVIKDEVLKITSEQLRDGEVYTQTYNVADLVVPIPNFVPSPNMGLTGYIQQAYENAGVFNRGYRQPPMNGLLAANGAPATNVEIDPAVMANLQPGAPFQNQGNAGLNPGGPGGLNGATQPNFDDLIQLITSTVHPYSWDAVGGNGTLREFDTNLSLVISQTQEVHEEIADLLQQLRRLQDLQVTIEVRFITLNDNFFERIGVDFDFDIDDDSDIPFQVFGRPQDAATTFTASPLNVGAGNPPRDVQDRDHGPSATVGMSMPGVFSSDLDIPVAQGSFPLAVPQFGGFQPGAGAQVGFAILSDLEAFFFIEASQGDRRSNVLQAPKVTLFNGQSATVSDTSQTPFVISIIPVVGDFAAGQQPIVAVLNEGTHLTVNAVASEDRRFVRMTVVPFFSTIEDVNEFTFDGTSTEASAAPTANDLLVGNNNTQINTQSATTVQLPTFSFITVSTTVSVPDGGTVLLGGIKRLSEGRNEFGVPLLSKVPYVNRLFRNVAIGRETQSLMMMVTPRIIIQEEEERMLLQGN